MLEPSFTIMPLPVRTEADAAPAATPVAAGFTRRDALKLAAVGLVGAGLGFGAMPMLHRARRPSAPAYRFFTDTEALLVTAICDQLIPADDAPGATDAHVIGFIDRQLAGPYAKHQAAYRAGLAALDATSRQQHAAGFTRLDAAAKIAVLEAVESGRVPPGLWHDPKPGAFFNLILTHTMQGFYGSPRHGGNRAFASYRMLELELPQVVGRNVYPSR